MVFLVDAANEWDRLELARSAHGGGPTYASFVADAP
jgi:hypothetical protein